jgi:hypothetical protein
MILSVENLRQRIDCGAVTDDQIAVQLEAIEAVIRAYTNNNFQQRAIRFCGSSDGSPFIYGVPHHFSVGDTVQVSSPLNGGLYAVVAVDVDGLEFDKELLPCEENLVTKIQYPADVVQCAVDLYSWKQRMGKKVGVKSETLSRHSVTYEDSATLYMGYPVGILNGLNLHKKARC